jgi:ribulose-5-phosphate 4-epimerase/fuculose-1-phosphate aldolase
MEMPTVGMGPIFEDRYKEREYRKGRLALAFRIFAKMGFDEGVAGHITLRVRIYCSETIHVMSYRTQEIQRHSG